MKTKLVRSIVMIVALLSLAGLTTYAVFTAAPVTLANNSVSTGSANAAVCNMELTTWGPSVEASFAVNNLVPGEENEQELTENKTIFLGNDGGNLVESPGTCSSYINGPGSSDISMRFIPKVNFTNCTEEAKDGISLDLDMGESLRSGYRTLREWESNTDLIGPVYQKNEARQIQMYAALSLDSALQSTNCQFDVIFDGLQADEEL